MCLTCRWFHSQTIRQLTIKRSIFRKSVTAHTNYSKPVFMQLQFSQTFCILRHLSFQAELRVTVSDLLGFLWCIPAPSTGIKDFSTAWTSAACLCVRRVVFARHLKQSWGAATGFGLASLSKGYCQRTCPVKVKLLLCYKATVHTKATNYRANAQRPSDPSRSL